MKRSRLSPVSKKRRKSRVGKLGIVRLAGKDMESLRQAAYDRSMGLCEMKLKGCEKYAGWISGNLAHVRTKRNNGDTIDNVLWACAHCHIQSHNPKACPPKLKSE